MKFTDQFNKIFVINLRRRADRLIHFWSQMEIIGVNPSDVEVFEAYDKPLISGAPNGNAGCTASHRGVLEIIAHNKWDRVCVFEDDVAVRDEFAGPDFPARFSMHYRNVPERFNILYLGGHYANDPLKKINGHCIEVSRMLTTSSYVIGHEMARRMAPYISGVGPIDNLFGNFTEHGGSYCLFPRLFVQYTSHSDLTDQTADYKPSMTDKSHEKKLGFHQ